MLECFCKMSYLWNVIMVCKMSCSLQCGYVLTLWATVEEIWLGLRLLNHHMLLSDTHTPLLFISLCMSHVSESTVSRTKTSSLGLICLHQGINLNINRLDYKMCTNTWNLPSASCCETCSWRWVVATPSRTIQNFIRQTKSHRERFYDEPSAPKLSLLRAWTLSSGRETDAERPWLSNSPHP